MKWERAGLLVFLGNYLINTIIAGALIALLPVPATKGVFTPQYIAFALVSALFVGALTWWFISKSKSNKPLIDGSVFGALGFIVSIASTFISGISSIITGSGSVAQALSIIPSFGPFLENPATLVLLGVWIIPAVFIGYMMPKPHHVHHHA